MHGIRIERDRETIVLSARGELDAYAAPELTERLAEAQADGAVPLVIDLTAVSFLDSTALGAVVRALKTAGDGGAASRVVLPTSAARRIFEITTLDEALPVAASRADALLEVRAAR